MASEVKKRRSGCGSAAGNEATGAAESPTRTRHRHRGGPPPHPHPHPPGRLGAAGLLGLVLTLGWGVKCYRDWKLLRQREDAQKALGSEGMFLFSSLDANNDLYLSPEEFRPIAEKLTGVSPAPDFDSDEDLDPNGETLTIVAKLRPLILESMTKSKDGFLGVSHGTLSGLKNWKTPAIPSGVFSARQFKVFLPPKSTVRVGDTWWMVPSELSIFTGYLSNNRFYPPAPQGREVLIHNLLSMLHPRPFVKSRFAPQGAVACIRGLSDFYYDIVFRIHAEFQLNEPPDFPFWFTPGQFTGNIVISKDASHVRDFWMNVPNDRSLNVDMEWLYGASESGNMEVDIGYLPQMELSAVAPSVPSIITDENGNTVDSGNIVGEPIQFVFEDIEWRSEISFDEAAQNLETTMYPFKKVSYLPFTEVFERAKAEDKLVHSILLWGALDDQSC